MNFIKNQYNKFKLIINYNYILSKRMKKNESFYAIIIFSLIFLIICPTIFLIITDHERFSVEISSDLTIYIYILLVFEIMMIAFRNSYNTLILPNQIAIFSVSNKFIFKYLLLSLIYDFKALIYFIPITFIIYSILRINFYTGLFSIFVFIIFYLNIEIWFVNTYLFLSKKIVKFKKNLSAIPTIMLILIFIFDKMIDYKKISDIPPIGWVGKSIGFAKDGHLFYSLIYFILLISLTIIGFWFGSILVTKIEYDY
jgi:hypothetical protein